jgi:carbon starvation protein
MNGALLVAISALILFAAYHVYGKYLEKSWGIDPKRTTPAHEVNDGVDYVPAKKSVIFGHQFSSIAGAGPINGPIIAAMFGWVPVILWILIGGIFIGALQDFVSMYASVRSKGKSIGYIIERYIGVSGKTLFLIFVWLFCILVIAAFADVVAATFNGFTEIAGELNRPNGSTASTSILFIVAALVFALFNSKLKPSALMTSTCAIILVVACIALGLSFPIFLPKSTWSYLVFGYIFIASVLPVWLLLQPRDYLSAYLLIAMILASFVGIAAARPAMNLPAFNGFVANDLPLFPMIFVVIACGAVSGFHSLVSTGTASKQISNERDMKFVSFGAMLFESLLAVIALVAVGALYTNNTMPHDTPPVIFAQALTGFLNKIGVPSNASFTLITLSISAFAMTSLDTVARIGRLAFQELFSSNGEQKTICSKFLGNKYIATIITLLIGYTLSTGGYMNIWPLFGSSNQLLAALTLITAAVYLKKTGKKGSMLYIPMIFMLVVTLTALGITLYKLMNKLVSAAPFSIYNDGIQLVFAVLLTGLAVIVAWQGIANLRKPKKSSLAI